MIFFCSIFPPTCFACLSVRRFVSTQAHPCFSNGGYLFYLFFRGLLRKLNASDHWKGHCYLIFLSFFYELNGSPLPKGGCHSGVAVNQFINTDPHPTPLHPFINETSSQSTPFPTVRSPSSVVVCWWNTSVCLLVAVIMPFCTRNCS